MTDLRNAYVALNLLNLGVKGRSKRPTGGQRPTVGREGVSRPLPSPAVVVDWF